VLGGDVKHHRPWCNVKDKVIGKRGWTRITETFDKPFPVVMTMHQEEELHAQHVSAMVTICGLCGAQHPYTFICSCHGLLLLEAPEAPLLLEAPQPPTDTNDHLISWEELCS
jgi:hypothetical protein